MNILFKSAFLLLISLILIGCDQWEPLSCELNSADVKGINITAQDVRCEAAVFNKIKIILSVQFDAKFDEGFQYGEHEVILLNAEREPVFSGEDAEFYEFKKVSSGEIMIEIGSRSFIDTVLKPGSHGYVVLELKENQRIVMLELVLRPIEGVDAHKS